MPLRQNLLALYHCDEASSTDDLTDSFGGNTLTHTGSPVSNSGILSGSRVLGGGSSDGFSGTVAGLNTRLAFTVAGWVKFSDASIGGRIFGLAFDQVLLFVDDSGGPPIITLRVQGIDDLILFNSPFSSDTWTFVALVSDGSSQYKLYISGSTTNGVWEDSFTTNSQVELAASGGATNTAFDELMVYSRALTGDELDRLYNSGSGLLGPFFNYSLAFSVQPSNTDAGGTITPAVKVEIHDEAGALDATTTDSIALAIGTNPSAGTLSGTTTQSAVAGVATYSDLSIDNPGTGYTLDATATGLTTATSNAFDIGTIHCSADLTVHNIQGAASATFSTGAHTITAANGNVRHIVAAATMTTTRPVFTGSAAPTVHHIVGAASATFSPGTHTATTADTVHNITGSASATFSPGIHTATTADTVHNIRGVAAATFAPLRTITTASGAVRHIAGVASVIFAPGVAQIIVANFTAHHIHGAASALFIPAPVFTGTLAHRVRHVHVATTTTFAPGTHTAAAAMHVLHVHSISPLHFSAGVHTAFAVLLAPAPQFEASGTVRHCRLVKKYRHVDGYRPHPRGRIVRFHDHLTYHCISHREELHIVTHIKRFRLP